MSSYDSALQMALFQNSLSNKAFKFAQKRPDQLEHLNNLAKNFQIRWLLIKYIYRRQFNWFSLDQITLFSLLDIT